MTGILVLAVLLGAFSQSGEDLFQKALRLERNEGKLMEAIELYNRVVAQGKDETLAAQAQLRIGLCYEKLGQKTMKQAQEAFQKVIDNYPTQSEEVRIAKEKLTSLIEPRAASDDKGLKERQLLYGPELLYDGWLGAVSPDGKYVSIVDWETNDLAIRDLFTGEKQRLTDQKKEEGYPLFSRWSPDGKKIVYDWWNGRSFVDLRIIDVEEKRIRTIFNKTEAWPFDWFPDGEHILIGYAEDGIKMALLSLKDGTVQIIKECWQQMNARISPDGRFVAYNKPQKESSSEYDVYLCSIEEGIDIPLINHSSNDEVLGWSPDGRRLLIKSSRLGSVDAWLVSIKDGKVEGYPELVKKGIGGSSPLGFTKTGAFFYMTSKYMEDIYTASFDSKTGKILRMPKKLNLPEQGRNGSPAFSPDGEKLAYFSSHREKYSLRIYSPKAGNERIYPLQFKAFHPRWSPDGRTVLVTAPPRLHHHGIYQVNLETGNVFPIIPEENRAEDGVHAIIDWAPNAKAFYYVQMQRAVKDKIFRYNLAPRKWEIIHHADTNFGTFSLSPDGKWIAFLGRDFERELRIVPSEGGESQVLCRFTQKGGAPIEMAWTPDCKYILFFHAAKEEVLKQELCRVPFSGGELEVLEISMVDPDDPSMHPNGREIVFNSEGFTYGYPEYWVMENFLPKK
jgi:Tol biopolymer transport system component